MLTGGRQYRAVMHGPPSPPQTHTPISIGTLAECLEHRHTVAAYCSSCSRWSELDLPLLVALGWGDRLLSRCRPRCSVCRSLGKIQLRVPMPTWDGPAGHSSARPIHR